MARVPESDGRVVVGFRPGLFQPAVDLGLPVYPVAITYSSGEAAYVGATSFLQSLLCIARARGLKVHLAMLPALRGAGSKRREAAASTRVLLLAGVHFSASFD